MYIHGRENMKMVTIYEMGECSYVQLLCESAAVKLCTREHGVCR